MLRRAVARRAIRTACAALASLGAAACDRDETARLQPAVPDPGAASQPPHPEPPGVSVRPAVPQSQGPQPQGASSTAPSTSPALLPDPTTPRLRSERGGFVVVTRDDCQRGRATYDLVVHFHGVADAVERQWNEKRLDGVLAVSNAGTWGRDYKAVYEHPGAYEALLERVDAELAELCPKRPPRAGRVALAGWSAGYAAVRALLRHGGADTVDAVLLSDGLHASLLTDSGNRHVLPEDVAPFVAFGKRAVEGTRLFSITHSSISTPDYASTTETSDYLLGELDLRRTPVVNPTTGTVRLLSEAHRAGFHLRGYSGETGAEHGWHLHALDETLFDDLAKWWSRPEAGPRLEGEPGSEP